MAASASFVVTPIIILSPEQEEALSEYSAGKNIFLTGPGGSGKTELIKQMVRLGKEAGKEVQVCALTGCAALLLNCAAKTVHSWAGIGLANGSNHDIIKKLIDGKVKAKIQKWKKTDVLIIDEVSMMSKKIFNLLDEIGRRIRKKYDVPFGGLQVIFSGDFYQLPPVSKANNNNNNFEDIDENEKDAGAFCFESDNWATTFHTTIQLKTIFRQTDLEYCKILNQIRVGKLYKSSLDILSKHIGKQYPTNGFKPTKLFPRKKEVEIINRLEYAALAEEEHVFKINKVKEDQLSLSSSDKRESMFLSEAQKEMELNFLLNNVIVDKELRLKKGTQVMCVANIDMACETVLKPIVNGSQGIIVDFVGEGITKGFPLVQFNNGTKRIISPHIWQSETIKSIAITQIPLIYAWGITIHKAQGASLDSAEIDAGSNIFECGQTYVALSRIKSLEGLYLTAFNPSKIKVNKKVQDFYGAIPLAVGTPLNSVSALPVPALPVPTLSVDPPPYSQSTLPPPYSH
uniref:AAA+ ATPase domain-containing protein n=1 Tax=viral metagenome TaxID=1070528 RepID=A0A6C0HGE0_9ZZZZ